VLSVRDLAPGFLLSLALLPQELPPGVSLKAGEQQHCRAPFADLKGTPFAGVVRAIGEEDGATFEIYVEHASYKAKTAEQAVEYAPKRRANITLTGNKIDDGDIIVFDGTVFLVSAEKPAPAEVVKFVNDVFLCIAQKKP
jgi:hypothetical protein